MSLAPSKRRPSAKPAPPAKPAPSARPTINLGHSFDGFAAVHYPDGHFLFRRIEEPHLYETSATGSVTLDRVGYKTPVLADIIVSVWRPGTEQQRA